MDATWSWLTLRLTIMKVFNLKTQFQTILIEPVQDYDYYYAQMETTVETTRNEL